MTSQRSVSTSPHSSRIFSARKTRTAFQLARGLLPVQEVFAPRDLLGVAQDLRATMRRRTQADHVRTVPDGPVVRVMSFVMEGDVDGHK